MEALLAVFAEKVVESVIVDLEIGASNDEYFLWEIRLVPQFLVWVPSIELNSSEEFF